MAQVQHAVDAIGLRPAASAGSWAAAAAAVVKQCLAFALEVAPHVAHFSSQAEPWDLKTAENTATESPQATHASQIEAPVTKNAKFEFLR